MTTTTFDPAQVQTPSWLGLPGVEETSEAAATPTATSFDDEDLFGHPFSTGPVAVLTDGPAVPASIESDADDPRTSEVEHAVPAVTPADAEDDVAKGVSPVDEAADPVAAALPFEGAVGHNGAEQSQPSAETVELPAAETDETADAESAENPVEEILPAPAEPRRRWFRRKTKQVDQDEDETQTGMALTKTTATAEELVAAASEYEVVRKVKKFPLIDPDQFWVMIVAICGLGGILAANLGSSFTAVYAMAATIGMPEAVQWLPVIILDVAIVGFSWVLMVFMSRGAPVGRTRTYLFIVTSFSVVANFMHTYEHWHGNLTTAPAIYGAVFSASIPLMALAATEELIRLVFIRRHRTAKKKDQNA